MDVNRAQAISALQNNAGGGRDEPHHDDEKPEDEPEHDARDADAFEIAGLAAELTPAAQRALDGLVAELEPLRAQLALAREREDQLKQDLARHAFLPVPGRREFLRELNHVLNHLGQMETPSSVAILHVANADGVRRAHGRDMLDRYLVHVADTVSKLLAPTDVVGNLGGNDFALILLGIDKPAAVERVAGICRALADRPFAGTGTPIPVETIGGAAMLSHGMSAEAALQAADRALAGAS